MVQGTENGTENYGLHIYLHNAIDVNRHRMVYILQALAAQQGTSTHVASTNTRHIDWRRRRYDGFAFPQARQNALLRPAHVAESEKRLWPSVRRAGAQTEGGDALRQTHTTAAPREHTNAVEHRGAAG